MMSSNICTPAMTKSVWPSKFAMFREVVKSKPAERKYLLISALIRAGVSIFFRLEKVRKGKPPLSHLCQPHAETSILVDGLKKKVLPHAPHERPCNPLS